MISNAAAWSASASGIAPPASGGRTPPPPTAGATREGVSGWDFQRASSTAAMNDSSLTSEENDGPETAREKSKIPFCVRNAAWLPRNSTSAGRSSIGGGRRNQSRKPINLLTPLLATAIAPRPGAPAWTRRTGYGPFIHQGSCPRGQTDAGATMLQGWVVVGIALAYIGFLFAVASYGDRMRARWGASGSRPLIYPLSLAVYCTSWTFFGSVGFATKQGLDFLTIYLGPILMIGLGYPLILKMLRLAKTQNITSIADFIAARYGKSQLVAAIVTLVAVIGAVPYIALPLKAVSTSLLTILGQQQIPVASIPIVGDLALMVAVT